MSDLRTWTADNTPMAVRLAGSTRIHRAEIVLGRVLIPACGASNGSNAARIPCTDDVTCRRCA